MRPIPPPRAGCRGPRLQTVGLLDVAEDADDIPASAFLELWHRPEADGAAERIEGDQAVSRVPEATARPRPVYAQLIALVAVEGLPVSQAGAAFGLSGGAARVRLHRARTRLREWSVEPVPAVSREELR